MARELEIQGPGDYLSEEFLLCIRKKIELVIASIAENTGKIIVWSDVDIRFFDLSPDGLVGTLGESDIAFQRESRRSHDVNTGFFVCRCTERIRQFFERVRSELEHRAGENEQMVVNRLLETMSFPWPRWGCLPASYYARTHGWPPPVLLTIYHANYTKGPDAIGQKLAQFREVAVITRGGLHAWLWSVLRRIPGKFFRF